MISLLFAPQLAGIANHLWQSSLFACRGSTLVALALRGHRARFRHTLWLCASAEVPSPLRRAHRNRELLAQARSPRESRFLSAPSPRLAGPSGQPSADGSLLFATAYARRFRPLTRFDREPRGNRHLPPVARRVPLRWPRMRPYAGVTLLRLQVSRARRESELFPVHAASRFPFSFRMRPSNPACSASCAQPSFCPPM